MDGKRGDISLSFSTIFSIILIIAIISTAVYAITHFINLKKCTEIALFYRDLQESIDTAWNSDSSSNTFEWHLPSGIDSVCLGNISDGRNTREYALLRSYRGEDANLFLYPPSKACDVPLVTINHVRLPRFSCVPVKDGGVKLRIEKGSYDALVGVRKP